MKIVKANGDVANFDPDKIVKSLQRAGADQRTIIDVVAKTEKEIYEGIETKALYKIVFKNLRRISNRVADKYHLKKAIMDLGPTGFPFEKYVASLWEKEGYHAITNQMVKGHCVKHEVDVIVEKGNDLFMIECKFHGMIGNICDVKHTLYVYARFLDLVKKWKNHPEHQRKNHQGWLITNTRLSSDAQSYGECVGMGLMSWNYPQGKSLRDKIDRHKLYPITCLTSLNKRERQALFDKNVILSQSIYERPSLLNGIGMTEKRKQAVLEEAQNICLF